MFIVLLVQRNFAFFLIKNGAIILIMKQLISNKIALKKYVFILF